MFVLRKTAVNSYVTVKTFCDQIEPFSTNKYWNVKKQQNKNKTRQRDAISSYL